MRGAKITSLFSLFQIFLHLFLTFFALSLKSITYKICYSILMNFALFCISLVVQCGCKSNTSFYLYKLFYTLFLIFFLLTLKTNNLCLQFMVYGLWFVVCCSLLVVLCWLFTVNCSLSTVHCQLFTNHYYLFIVHC